MRLQLIKNELLLPEVEEMLKEGHSVTLRLTGHSMNPYLVNRRDKALLVRAEATRVGDVVLAKVKGGYYVLHRVAAIEGDTVTLRGDGNLNTETCAMKDVVAKAAGFYRKGRDTLEPTTGRKWLVYSWMWTRLLPLRRYLLYIYRHFITLPENTTSPDIQ